MQNKRIGDFLQLCREKLAAGNLDSNIGEIIVETRLQLTRSELWQSHGMPLEQEMYQQCLQDLDRYLAGEPIQYILKTAPFFGYDFYVDNHVLIPRPETEELVYKALETAKKTGFRKVLDICTGSGVIGITMKKELPELTVTLSDISPEALQVSKKNAQQLGAEVRCIETDVADYFVDNCEKYQLIIANPPYIAEHERLGMSDLVLKNEPELALFAENNGLAIYEKLVKQLPAIVEADFWIGVEIGYQQGESVRALFRKSFPQVPVVIHKDINGKDRMVICSNTLV
ncbi:peptide chain release factor N(5)-glutamine methyltransferase [Listeria grayi]|uniref:peptide chain release factor N(5)-glutamine methyltransferase n=1 Tax=Listeria grayi TaxID=1641 RepID=UPI001623E5EF|nr:peptide chain release factor N(5)-glutamine methyltransferase [Listeria grayi]MBC1922630.1 peptide chain release factor N(5)-glutamine methyltransferase [Listeria grayi]